MNVNNGDHKGFLSIKCSLLSNVSTDTGKVSFNISRMQIYKYNSIVINHCFKITSIVEHEKLKTLVFYNDNYNDINSIVGIL